LWIGATSSVLVALACGPAVGVESVAFGELCEEDGPVRLLSLEEGAVVGSDRRSVVRNGDGWLIGVRGEVETDVDATARIVSVGPCGEEERVVARGVDTVLAPPEADQPWFACNEAERTMAWIDPTGRAPAVPLATDECAVAWIGSEVVLAQAAAGGVDLVAIQFDERGTITSADVLVAGVYWWSHRTPVPDGSRAGPEPAGHVLAIADWRLLDVDVGARTSTTVLADVMMFGVGDGLVGVRSLSGPGLLLDPDGAQITDFTFSSHGANEGPFFGPGTVTLTRNSVANGNTWAVTLDDMLGHAMPGHLLRPVAQMSDGTRIFTGSSADGRGLFGWLPDDPVEHTESATFIDGPVELAWQDDGVWALFGDGRDEDPMQDLVLLDDPALTRRVVLRDVYRPLRLPRSRWMSVSIDRGSSGRLLVLADGGDELFIVDEDVHMEFASYQSARDRVEVFDGESPLFYMVTEPHRRGLWMARPLLDDPS
jgi:hypothetical protein